MSEQQVIPAWVSLAMGALGPIGACVAFIFGRGSKSGQDSIKLNMMERRLDTVDKTLNDTVTTVSNHGQSIVLMNVRTGDLEKGVARANEGIATLLERTKNI
jgi:hypothetical protein